MMWPGRGVPSASRPSSASRATSRLPSVAESPSVRSAGRKRRSRARASSVCTPRLRAQQLVPLVDDDQLEMVEQLAARRRA